MMSRLRRCDCRVAQDQVRKASGSEALARQRAAEEGEDFEELTKQQYRINMTRLYYQKKIFR